MSEYGETLEDYSAEVPLQSPEAEALTLGSMLLSAKAAKAMADTLEVDDFRRPQHRLIFRSMQSLVKAGKPLDYKTLSLEMTDEGTLDAAGGPDYLTELDLSVPSAHNAPHYAGVVLDKATRRALVKACEEVSSALRQNRPMPEVVQMILGMPAKARSLPSAAMDRTWAQMVRDKASRPAPGGVRTGNRELDEQMPYGGLTNGQMTLSMAPTGEGKTTWMLGTIFAACDRGLRCAILTFADNSEDDVIERALRWKCGMPNLQDAESRAALLYESGYTAEADSVMARFKRAEDEIYAWDLEVYMASKHDEGGYYETAKAWLARKAEEGLGRMDADGVSRAPKKMSLAGWDYAQTIEVADPVASRFQHYGQQAWLARRMEKFCEAMMFPFIVCVQMTAAEGGKEYVEGCKVWEKVCELWLRIRENGLEIKKRRRGGKTGVMPRHRHDNERWCFVSEEF